MAKPKVSEQIDIHALKSVRLRALWVLDNVAGANGDRLTASRIARHLVNDYGISTSYQAVDYALQKSNGAVHKNRSGYKLMESGRAELLKSHNTEPPASARHVVFIESGKPFSAKSISIASVFQQLVGEVRISDPYVDANTLDVIFKHLNKGVPIKVLTQNITDRPAGILGRVLQDLTKEGYSIEIRVNVSGKLHDRYIMSRKQFWLSGNSLNHLGNKESFLVSLGEDVHRAMSDTFETRWASAAPYPH